MMTGESVFHPQGIEAIRIDGSAGLQLESVALQGRAKTEAQFINFRLRLVPSQPGTPRHLPRRQRAPVSHLRLPYGTLVRDRSFRDCWRKPSARP
jgi:hypothetical protein